MDLLGRIVVSGDKDDAYNGLKTVELNDVFANKWTQMPNMINSHDEHSLVSVKINCLLWL